MRICARNFRGKAIFSHSRKIAREKFRFAKFSRIAKNRLTPEPKARTQNFAEIFRENFKMKFSRKNRKKGRPALACDDRDPLWSRSSPTQPKTGAVAPFFTIFHRKKRENGPKIIGWVSQHGPIPFRESDRPA